MYNKNDTTGIRCHHHIPAGTFAGGDFAIPEGTFHGGDFAIPEGTFHGGDNTVCEKCGSRGYHGFHGICVCMLPAVSPANCKDDKTEEENLKEA